MPDLPKLAMQRLQQTGAAPGIHPDPNLISAFAENALPPGTRTQILDHLAQCADCREVVFLSTPDQAVALPAAAAARSNWLAWPVLRWSAAVAAIVVVGAAVSLHHQFDERSTPSDVSMRDASIAKETAASAPLPKENRELAAVTENAPSPPGAANGAVTNAEPKALNNLKKQNAPTPASGMLAQKSGATAGDLAGQRRDELDKSTAVGVNAQSTAVSAEAARVVPGRAKDSASESAENIGGAGVGGGVAPNAAAAFKSHPLMFTPMRTPRWTLNSDGTLQRSLDLGRSWQTIQVASQASFRALAASGTDIWVGGAKGALYHSNDAGQNWAQVQPVAAGQPLTDDIIGVEFPDSLHGKLTTSNKETWTTEDGGHTWGKP